MLEELSLLDEEELSLLDEELEFVETLGDDALKSTLDDDSLVSFSDELELLESFDDEEEDKPRVELLELDVSLDSDCELDSLLCVLNSPNVELEDIDSALKSPTGKDAHVMMALFTGKPVFTVISPSPLHANDFLPV